MNKKGGKRDNCGRHSRGLPTTKITVYKDCREILNNYSKQIGIPVVELIYRILINKHFKLLINDIKSSINKDNWYQE